MGQSFGKVKGERSFGDVAAGGGVFLLCNPTMLGGATMGVFSSFDEQDSRG